AVAAGTEVHLGEPGRVRVVDQGHRQTAEAVAEQHPGVGVDPALVDVGRRAHRGAALHHAGEGDPDRAGPAEVVDDLFDAVGHRVRGGRVRGQDLVALLREVPLAEVDRGALDPGSADVHAEDLHGTTVLIVARGALLTRRGRWRTRHPAASGAAPVPRRSATRAEASSRRSGRSYRGRETTMASSAARTISTSSKPRCASHSRTSSPSPSGTEAPEVRPTVVTPSSQLSSISAAKSTRWASRAPAWRATSTRRLELEELREPTTITRSASAPICLTASWRFCVA